MPKTLSQAQVESFRRDGFLFPLPCLSAGEAAHYRNCLETYEARKGGRLSQLGREHRYKTHVLLRWCYELVSHPAVLDALEDLMGPNILLYTSAYFIKEPGTPAIKRFGIGQSKSWNHFGPNGIFIGMAGLPSGLTSAASFFFSSNKP